MAGKTVNPTRMELTRLKGRLKTARRGHKLLKDKRDELMKQFLEVVRRNKALRAKVEQGLKDANAAFTVASALMGPEVLEESLSCPRRRVSLDVSTRNIMSVNVPVFTFHTDSGDDALLPYGFAQTSGELDAALEKLQHVGEHSRRCSPTCWSWPRWKRPCSCWPRTSKRPAAGSTPWNM